MLLLLNTIIFFSRNTPRKIICTKFFFLFVFLSSFLCGSMWNHTRASPIVQDAYKIILAFFWHKRAQYLEAVARTTRRWTEPVNARNSYSYFLFLLLLLLLVIIIIIIFATNKQCNHNFCTQQHCWYHMAYILYYWIRAYPITVLYLLLFYTLRLNTHYFIVYDISFFRTHHEIIIKFSFESIILLNLL